MNHFLELLSWRTVYLLLISCSMISMQQKIEARNGRGGAIAAGLFGGAVLGGITAAAVSQQCPCDPVDPGCRCSGYGLPAVASREGWGGPYVYYGPPAPVYYGGP